MIGKGDRIKICNYRYDNAIKRELIGKEGTVKLRTGHFILVELDNSITTKSGKTLEQNILLGKDDIIIISDLEEKVEKAL